MCQIDRASAADAHCLNLFPQWADGQRAEYFVNRTEKYVGGFPRRGGAACMVNQNAVPVDQGARNLGSANIEGGDQAIVRG